MPTPNYITGFEHGQQLVSGNSNGLAILVERSGSSVEAGAARTGSYGLKTTAAASAQGPGRIQLVSPSTLHAVCSFYWRAVDKPTTNRTIVWYMETPSAGWIEIVYNPSNNKLEFTLDQSTYTAAASTVTLNQWYRIDYHVYVGLATWYGDWMIDGVAQTRVTYANTAANISRIGPFHDGIGGNDPHGSIWNYDDIMTGAVADDYPFGEVKVLGTTADTTVAAEHQSITLTQWDTTTDFSGFTNFTGQTETTSRGLIDDLNTTDGIRINAAGDVAGNARWPVADPSGDPGTDPYGVSCITAAREASASAGNNAIFRTYLNGNTTNNFSGDPSWGTTWNYIRNTMATKPGGGAWSNADVKAIRFEADSTTASPAIWLGGFFYEVAYSNPSTTYVRYRVGKNVAAGTVDVIVSLYQGSTLIAQWPHYDLGTSLSTFEKNLSKEQELLITDTTDLRIRMVPTIS